MTKYMKQSIKKLLCYLLLLSIFGLSGCEKDLNENTQVNNNTTKTYYITGKQAKVVATKLGAQLNETLSDKGTTFRSNDGITVDYSSVMVVDNGTDVAYSLKADSDAESNLIFQNVVLIEKNNKTSAKLMTYQMTPQFAADYKNDLKDISQFKGTITMTTLTGRDACNPPVVTIPFDDNLPILTPPPTAGNSGGGGSTPSGGGNGTPTNGNTTLGQTGTSTNTSTTGTGTWVIIITTSTGGGSGTSTSGTGTTAGGSTGSGSTGGNTSGPNMCQSGHHRIGDPRCAYTLQASPHNNRLTYTPSSTSSSDGTSRCATDVGVYEDDYTPIIQPCTKLKAKVLEPVFKAKIDALNTPAAFSLNKESGFFESKTSSTSLNSYVNANASTDTHIINYILPHTISYAHVHTDTFINEYGVEAHTVKMLSPNDLISFIGTFQRNARFAQAPVEDTYAMMISRQGSYCLKLLSTDPFLILSNEQFDKFEEKYKNKSELLYGSLDLTQNADPEKLEYLLLDLLKEYHLDDKVGLFKATNADLTDWSQKKLSPTGAITTVPCI